MHVVTGCVKWTINLHKYIILYGLKMPKADHVFFTRIMYELLTTPNVDTVSADKFAKVGLRHILLTFYDVFILIII